MAPSAPRFQVELRANGRLIQSLGCGPELTIGEGGALVVPGLGGEVPLLEAGRVVAHAGLIADVDGARTSLRIAAHPELEITVEPLELLAIERPRWNPIPARETVVAGVLAGCLAALFGRTALVGELTEPERMEREDTALALAVYATPAVTPTFVPPRIVRYAEPEPIPAPIPAPIALPEPEPEVMAEPVAPLAQRVAKAKPRRRARPRVLETEALVSVLSSADAPMGELFALDMVGTSSLAALDDAVVGGVAGGVPGGVPGGVVGGEVGGGEVDIAPTQLPTAVAIAPSEGTPGDVATITEVAPAKPPADPRGGKFDLDDALAGHPSLAAGKPGTLTAILHTTKGEIRCALFENRAPRTVANFVGLALGTRESLDLASNEWIAKPFYGGSTFHRVVRGFVIQGGDPTGTGTGGPGYEIADEIQPDLRHDAAGVLSMANKGPNTAGSQFFVTLAAAPHIDGKSTVFGKCDVDVVARIGDVAVDDARQHRPSEPVTLRRVEIVRTAPIAEPAPVTDVLAEEVVVPDAIAPEPAEPAELE